MRPLDALLFALPTLTHPAVLATIVRTEGSSYRKAGARMLVRTDLSTLGALSGGCVEREVALRAKPVLDGGPPRVIAYDGRLRLGCEGTLYILLERLDPARVADLGDHLAQRITARRPYGLATRYRFPEGGFVEGGSVEDGFAEGDPEGRGAPGSGTTLLLGDELFPLGGGAPRTPAELAAPGPGDAHVLRQDIAPAPRLLVCGVEADGATLAHVASLSGRDVTLVAHPRNPLDRPPTAARPYPTATVAPGTFAAHLRPDAQTAVALMSHSYPRDYAYFRAIARGPAVGYLGILGPRHRRDRMLDAYFEEFSDVPEWLEGVTRGPMGIGGAGRNPGSIAVSVLAELERVMPTSQIANAATSHTAA